MYYLSHEVVSRETRAVKYSAEISRVLKKDGTLDSIHWSDHQFRYLGAYCWTVLEMK